MTKETNEPTLNISVSMEDGPIYSDKMICEGVNTFYLTGAEGTDEERLHGRKVDIDGQTSFAVPISEFGLSVSDFEHVPVNRFGLKVVAFCQNTNMELVVTANGLFVLYQDGIPSLKGLPSAVDAISGFYVDEDGFVLMPRMSLYSHAELASFAIMFAPMSFRDFDLRVLSGIHFIRARRTELEEPGELSVYRISEKELYSNFEKVHPKFTDSELKSYIDLRVKESTDYLGFIKRLISTPDEQTREALKARSMERKSVNALIQGAKSPISTDFRSRD